MQYKKYKTVSYWQPVAGTRTRITANQNVIINSKLNTTYEKRSMTQLIF